MNDQHLFALNELVGKENVSTNELDLAAYCKDLAPLPEDLLLGYGMVPAWAIVMPKTYEALAEVVKYCRAHEIVMTPRGAGSWALGSVLPMDGGVVIDLCGMKEILEIDTEDEYVRVQCGCAWKRVYDLVALKGYVIGANPSSGISATVGGFIATGGVSGFGVPQFGTVGEQVISLKVITPTGEIQDTGPLNSWTHICAEGTLGLVVEATLKIFEAPHTEVGMYAFSDEGDGAKALQALSKLEPYYLTCLNGNFTTMLNQVGEHFREASLTVAWAFRGSEDYCKQQARLARDACASGKPYAHRDAEHEWHHRYSTALAHKRLGPTLMVQEFRIPMRFFGDCLADLNAEMACEPWGLETLASDNDTVTFVIMTLTDERDRVDLLHKFSQAYWVPPIGFRNHGEVNGIGLHNAIYLKRIHGAGGVRVFRKIREHFDPGNWFLPSKTTQVRLPSIFIQMSMRLFRLIPWVVDWGLEACRYVPVMFFRIYLKLVGGELKVWPS